MAMSIFALDAMLAALPDIGRSLGITDENRRQLIVTSFWLGLAAGQIFYGPLADRFGRKPVLIPCLLAYAVFGALTAAAHGMAFMLAARFLQGAAAAGIGVLVAAIIRDRYAGDQQAQAQSLISTILLIVPVTAPFLGQQLLQATNWRVLLAAIASLGLAFALWAARLPETLVKSHRRRLAWPAMRAAVAEICSTRAVIGNIAVATLALAAFSAFIHSIQQIVADAFHRPDLLGITFVCFAAPVAVSYYINSRLVERHGSRALLLIALTGTMLFALLHLAVALSLEESLWTFVFLQALTMAWIGLTNANCSALLFDPVGHIAGTTSAMKGLATYGIGAPLGFFIGQMFDGTPIPLIAGFAACGGLALVAALWANPKAPRPAEEAR
jgi:DHA1 family bicyclomycin/chloramphenicol resistance-like MFS transporter